MWFEITGTGKVIVMPNLSTQYLGLNLKNPLVVGSSSQTLTPSKVEAFAEQGAGAVVLKSIFEEQIRADVADMVNALDSNGHTEA